MKRADHFTDERPTDVVIHINGSDSEDTDSADEFPSTTDTATDSEADDWDYCIEIVLY